jgi:hypothetical protein
MMVEFDLLLYRLRGIVRDNVYCEDGELRIRNKAKYDIVNLVEEIDKEWFKQLMKELEYDE